MASPHRRPLRAFRPADGLTASPTVTLVLPLILALVLASDIDGGPVAWWGLTPGPTLATGLAGGLLAWILLHLAAGPLLARHPSPRVIIVWERTCLVLGLGLHAFWCYGLHLPATAPGLLASLLPFALLLVLHDVALERALAPRGERSGLARQRLRFGLLPVLVLTGLGDLLDLALAAGMADDGPVTTAGQIATLTSLLAFPLLLMLALPPLLLRLWRTTPLPDGPKRDALLAALAQAGVRVRGLRRWPSPGGRFANAAVIGFLPGWRWVLVSDDLLAHLDAQALVAVLGHELGHVRHHHLWFYLLFLTAGGAAATAALEALAPWLHALPGPAWLGAAEREGLALLALIAVLVRVAFGALSRACERQADLAGAELAGSPADLQRALAATCELTHADPDAPSWLHRSIRARIAWLDQVRLDPHLAAWHHRHVMKWRIAIIAACVAAAAVFFDNRRPPTLEAMRAEDPRLDVALVEAGRGDPRRLRSWIDSAVKPEVQALAQRIMERCDAQPMDLSYRQRGWLLAFADISTGNPTTDLEMDNLLAYVLAAGSAKPTPDDVQVLNRVLPRLKAALDGLTRSGRTSSAVADTVGCVCFRLGRHSEAADAFRLAIAHADRELAALDPAEAAGPPGHRLRQTRALAESRLAASLAPDADLPLEDAVPALQPAPLPPGPDGPALRSATTPQPNQHSGFVSLLLLLSGAQGPLRGHAPDAPISFQPDSALCLANVRTVGLD